MIRVGKGTLLGEKPYFCATPPFASNAQIEELRLIVKELRDT